MAESVPLLTLITFLPALAGLLLSPLKAEKAAVVRWAHHVADPEDIDTYVHLSRHTRRGFIAQFPASRFLAGQMRFTQLLYDDIRREFAHDPTHSDRLRQLLMA